MDDEYWNVISRCYIVMMNKDCKGSTWSNSSFRYGDTLTVSHNNCRKRDTHRTYTYCEGCCNNHIEAFKRLYLEYRRREKERVELFDRVKRLEEHMAKLGYI